MFPNGVVWEMLLVLLLELVSRRAQRVFKIVARHSTGFHLDGNVSKTFERNISHFKTYSSGLAENYTNRNKRPKFVFRHQLFISHPVAVCSSELERHMWSHQLEQFSEPWSIPRVLLPVIEDTICPDPAGTQSD